MKQQKNQKTPLSFFCVELLRVILGPAVSVVYIPTQTPLEKTNLSFASGCHLEAVSWFLEVGGVCSCPGLDAGSLSAWSCVDPPHAAMVSMSSYMYQSCCIWKFPWCHLSPLALLIFPLPLLHSSLSLEERGLMKSSHLGLRVPRTVTLHVVQLWVSAFVPICCRRITCDDGSLHTSK